MQCCLCRHQRDSKHFPHTSGSFKSINGNVNSTSFLGWLRKGYNCATVPAPKLSLQRLLFACYKTQELPLETSPSNAASDTAKTTAFYIICFLYFSLFLKDLYSLNLNSGQWCSLTWLPSATFQKPTNQNPLKQPNHY